MSSTDPATEFIRNIAMLSLIVSFIGIIVLPVFLYLKHEHNRKMEVRRDVLRRLVGYSYRLTKNLKGTEGEPFIALNEAKVVFADCIQTKRALDALWNAIDNKLDSRPFILRVIIEMARQSNVPVKDKDREFFEKVFTPPERKTNSQNHS